MEEEEEEDGLEEERDGDESDAEDDPFRAMSSLRIIPMLEL